ncbi:SAV_2336 N-terminal domain-related protein [Streptomyces sp. NPDC048275]|uniref:SAV_2336 N-terminal domain-related protein n=1 Tax=Streptomyces sp. NPDC048275 TaxID=3155629 RepID=UPI00340DE94B
MRSEPTGARLLGRLAEILAEAGDGTPPTPVELAELLWLAAQMADSGPATRPGPAPEDVQEPRTPPTPSADEKDEKPEVPEKKPGPIEEDPELPAQPRNDNRVPLHLPSLAGPGTGTGTPHTSLLAPAPPMLRRPLALQRALRPLKRLSAAPVGHELDESATAHRIARLGGDPEWWLPVLRPARERWLSLRLVRDTGPTMPVWHPLIHELHTVLAQSGVFRTLTMHRAHPDGTVSGTGGDVPGDGRTITLLVSDCMGPQWWAGPAGDRWYATLRRWSHRMPLALVQPLPERLWGDTALSTTPGLLSAPFPAAPLSSLAFTPYETSGEPGAADAVPLPVLEPDAAWLAHWSALVANPGGSQLPGSVAHLTSRPAPPDASANRSDVTRLPAEELVLRFRASASPEAFRLAGHLAVGRPDLPVMRLVQAAVEPRPRPQHLAEVILSGMLTTVPGPEGSYAFRPGVQELLLRSLPRTARGRTSRLLARMGAAIDERAGAAAGEFRASTPTATGTEAAGGGEPIATVRPESVRRLLGTAAEHARSPRRTPALRDRYRFVERLGPSGSLWRAEDTELRREVVVRLYPSRVDPQDFLRDARATAGIDHPNVVKVHDYGVEDEKPYVVMEHLDGVALNSLASAGGYRLPAPLLVSLGRQLAAALTTIHGAGVTHGGPDMTKILILPDGTAKLTPPDLAHAAGEEGMASDLRALGRLVFQLSSGGPARAGGHVLPEQLTALPTQVRPTYTSALRLLLADNPALRQQGADLLRSPDLPRWAESAHSPLRYTLLGPPRAERGTRPLALGSPQERAMLCMLLLRHGRKVTHGELSEGIWGPKPPARARAFLGTYASRLRNALGPGVLATLSDGYALHTSADFVDVVDCRRSVASAERERADGRYEFALAHVNNALALWHGTALDDVPGPAAEAARTRLLQLRLSLCATRAELGLDLGDFEGTATDLAALVRAHPSREDFRRLHQLALQRRRLTNGPVEERPSYTVENPSYTTERPGYLRPDHPPLPYTLYRTCVFFDFADGPQDPDALAALGRAVTRLLTESGLERDQYQLRRRGHIHTAVTEEGVSALPLLSATLLRLPDIIVELGGPRVRVTFWCVDTDGPSERPDPDAVQAALEASEARGIIAVPWYLRDELDEEDPASVPLLSPLDPESEDGRYSGWHRLCHLPRSAYDGTHPPPPVRGPYPLPTTRTELPQPLGRKRTVVYALPHGELRPASRHIAPSPTAESYYEVDLTERRTALELDVPGPETDQVPVFAARGQVTWRVTDPAEAVRQRRGDVPGYLTRHLLAELLSLTSDYPPSHLSEADEVLDARLSRWVLPGYALDWSVSLSAPPRPNTPAPRRPDTSVGEALLAAEGVLLGFDGPLTRLYGPGESATALRELAGLLVERRGPEAAPSPGQPLPHGDPLEGYANPLDLLRTFARHELAHELRTRLDAIETRAARSSPPRTGADLLVRTLESRGVGLTVVTDIATAAVETYLRRRGLDTSVRGGVHGRDPDLGLIMPHTHSLRRALDRLGIPAQRCLMIGSTVAEQSAARTLGVPFLAFTPDQPTRTRLLAAGGAQLLVWSHNPLLDAVRSPRSP